MILMDNNPIIRSEFVKKKRWEKPSIMDTSHVFMVNIWRFPELRGTSKSSDYRMFDYKPTSYWGLSPFMDSSICAYMCDGKKRRPRVFAHSTLTFTSMIRDVADQY